MNDYCICLLIVAAMAAGVRCEDEAESPVLQCKDEKFEELQKRVNITPCGPKVCKLQKHTTVKVTFKFKPTKAVETLVNYVRANIKGIWLPFVGVTGQDACDNIRVTDTGEAAPCPLEPGIEYSYENEFYIKPLYPIVSHFTVHWGLKDGDRNVICFEVPAAIVKGKSKKA